MCIVLFYSTLRCAASFSVEVSWLSLSVLGCTLVTRSTKPFHVPLIFQQPSNSPSIWYLGVITVWSGRMRVAVRDFLLVVKWISSVLAMSNWLSGLSSIPPSQNNQKGANDQRWWSLWIEQHLYTIANPIARTSNHSIAHMQAFTCAARTKPYTGCIRKNWLGAGRATHQQAASR
jgi:hypothetical protein